MKIIYNNRNEVEARQFYLKMQLAKVKKKSFSSTGEKNKFDKETINPLKQELLSLCEIWGKLK